jgi:hypothetical protein
MSQEINLKRYLGRNPTDAEIEAFAQVAIERINLRTLEGETIHGGKFKQYSKAYAEKKGVSRDSVDLFLEGDMLDALNYESTSDSVKIVIDDSLEAKKGYNHHTGDTLPKRPWFGITTDEARTIAESIKDEDDSFLSDKFSSAVSERVTQVSSARRLSDLERELAKLGLDFED